MVAAFAAFAWRQAGSLIFDDRIAPENGFLAERTRGVGGGLGLPAPGILGALWLMGSEFLTTDCREWVGTRCGGFRPDPADGPLGFQRCDRRGDRQDDFDDRAGFARLVLVVAREESHAAAHGGGESVDELQT
jgi:hypothetical protein